MAATIRRRFVNIVAENCKSGGVCSVHRLDVSKHLFYPTTTDAYLANTGGGMMMVERLPELPAPCTCVQPSPTTVANGGSKMAFFGLVSPSSSESRILCINDAGHYYALATDQPQTLMPLWQDRTPVEWKATKIDLLNLGSGRFVIAKVCKVIPGIGESGLDEEDEFLVLTGVEIHHRGRFFEKKIHHNLETFQHKSIRYICSNDRIHQVL